MAPQAAPLHSSHHAKPLHPNRELGQALLESAEAQLAGLGARRFDAMVLDGNELGRRLWQTSGYRGED